MGPHEKMPMHQHPAPGSVIVFLTDRNNRLTHKIDPDIDLEREYLGETFYETGLLSQLTHVTPPDPLTQALTATGGSFHSDGRILVMVLASKIAETN